MRVAACTIVSKNYLAYARVLAESFSSHHPDIPFIVLLVDTIDDYFEPRDEPFDLVPLEALGISGLARLCFQYSILELNTAVKPYFLEYLLQTRGLDKVAYFDPDILILAPVTRIFELLGTDSIVLTPHLTAPLPDDGGRPDEIDILQAGTYNLGFIGLARGSTAESFLEWWKARLSDRCRVDVANGMHVDQRWVDLVPGFFEDVHILREETYNVAYWNLPTRPITMRDGRPLVHGRPIHFMHFSGIDPRRPDLVSKHDTRFKVSDLAEGASLFRRYIDLLEEHGYRDAICWPYAFARFDNDVPIPPAARQLYLDLGPAASSFGNPFQTGAGRSYYSWLLEDEDDAEGVGPSISRLMYAEYRKRPDLQRAFPDLRGDGRLGLVRWFERHGRDHGIDSRFFEGGRLLAVDNGGRPPAAASFRTRAGRRLGINLAGYVASEKGVGQAARSMIRALTVAGVPHVINPIVDPSSENREAPCAGTSESNPYPVNLALIGVNDVRWFVETRPPDYFVDRRTVAHLAWELADLPSDLARNLDVFDEIWVASSFVADGLRDAVGVPVVRIPYPILDEVPLNLWHPFHFGLPKGAFVFLFMFDFDSYVERKNPLGLIEAFKRAFRPEDPALLVLKCTRASESPEALGAMQEAGAGFNVRIMDSALSRQQVRTLLHLSDCYVSLHRAEGFGLTMAEAMAMAKPVIATAYSGNMDFMTPTNSFPIRYRLKELDRDYGPYRRGAVWAEPDIDHAAELMRFVYANREHARDIGLVARREVLESLGAASVGAAIRHHLERGAASVDRPTDEGSRGAPPT